MAVVDAAWLQIASMGKIIDDSYIEEIELRSLYYEGSVDRFLIRFCLERARGRVPDPSSFKIDMKRTDIRSLPSPACP